MDTQKIQQSAEEAVTRFLQRAPLEESALILDGMGVNSAYHYFVLSALGIDRLEKLRYFCSVSAGTFPLLFFWGYKKGYATVSIEELKNWDKWNRQAHRIPPLFYLIQFGFSRLFPNKKGFMPAEGFSRALGRIVKPEFLALRVAELPANFRIPLYNVTEKKLEIVEKANPKFAAMTVSELLCAAPAIEGIFPPVRFNGCTYLDPVFSPAAKDVVRTLRGDAKNALVSNLFRSRTTENAIYWQARSGNGQFLIFKDLLLFLAGIPNGEVYPVASAGLLGERVEA
jgi:predicted acylesterase/phospholipase RssA